MRRTLLAVTTTIAALVVTSVAGAMPVPALVAPTGPASAPATAAAAPAPAAPAAVTGTLQIIHSDPADRAAVGAHGETFAVVETSSGPIDVDPAAMPAGVRSGDTVSVDATGRVTLVRPARSSRAASGIVDALLVMTSWPGNPANSVTKAQGDAAMANVETWYDTASGGRLDVAPTTYGWIDIATPTGSCAGSGSVSWAYSLRTNAEAALTTAGVPVSSYDRVIFYFPETAPEAQCAWAGLGGTSMWLAGTLSLGVIAHELGHTFALGHANTLTCLDGAVAVTVSGECTSAEYADRTDMMGSGTTAMFGGPHLLNLGWVQPDEVVDVPQPTTGSTTSTRTLVPLEVEGDGVRVIRLRRADGSAFYLENRQRLGVDSTQIPSGSEGVRLHFTPSPQAQIPCGGTVSGFGCVGSSYLLKPVPSASGAANTWRIDPAVGWAHGDGTLSVTVTALTATTFSVTVTHSAPPPPVPSVVEAVPVPEGVHLSWTAGAGAQSAPATRYAVRITSGGYTWVKVIASTALSATIDTEDLMLGERYAFAVAGWNPMGSGVFSTDSRAVVAGPQAPFATWEAFVARQLFDFAGGTGSPTTFEGYVAALEAGSITPDAFIEARMNGPWYGPVMAPVARLYWAYFGRTPDASGLRYWAARRRAGVSLNTVSQSFASSAEFARTYGPLSNGAFVDLVYGNVLGRAPDAAGRAYWVGELTSGRRNRGQVMSGFSESLEYRTKMAVKVTTVLVYVGMMGRSPTGAELVAAAPLSTQALIESIRVSAPYDSRVA